MTRWSLFLQTLSLLLHHFLGLYSTIIGVCWDQNRLRHCSSCFKANPVAKTGLYPKQYKPQLDERQSACAFCGSRKVDRWDHLIPIRENGETVPGNMVLACETCDDSKGRVSFKQWMRGGSAKSPKKRKVRDLEDRIQRLDAYMQAFGYVPIPLEKRLDPDELASLSRIRKDLTQLRDDVDTLIKSYRTRMGLG